jgi:hypothetical protein
MPYNGDLQLSPSGKTAAVPSWAVQNHQVLQETLLQFYQNILKFYNNKMTH